MRLIAPLLTSTSSRRLPLTALAASTALLGHFSPAASANIVARQHQHNHQSILAHSASASSHFSTSVTSSAMGSNASTAANFPKGKSDEEWRAQLSPEQFRILRKKGTEMAGSGEYDKHYPSEGVYGCAGCGTPLYKADTKFKSGCGWPAFFDAIPGAIDRHEDRTFGMTRIECTCAACGGHLGHIFKGEGFDTPTDERHCVNSVSIKFSPQDN